MRHHITLLSPQPRIHTRSAAGYLVTHCYGHQLPYGFWNHGEPSPALTSPCKLTKMLFGSTFTQLREAKVLESQEMNIKTR